jgi:hypothetical protein
VKRTAFATGLVTLLVAASAHADPRSSACADAAERGQELSNAHRPIEARAQFLICVQRECPAIVRDACTEWLTNLARITPTLVAGAKDEEGHDLAAVSVTLDGAPLPENVTSTAVPANPGSHVVRWALAGYDPAEETVVLREGEPVRVLSVMLRRASLAVPPPPSPPPVVTARPKGLPVVPIVLGAASVVALGVFSYAGLKGASDYRDLERECGGHCASDRIDGVRSTFLVADVALVVAAVSAGAALTVWLVNRPPAPPREARSR